MEKFLQHQPSEEAISQKFFRNDDRKHHYIPRKPVPVRSVDEPQSKGRLQSSSRHNQDASDYLAKHITSLDLDSKTPVLPPRPSPSLDTTALSVDTVITRSDTYGTATTASSLSASTSTPDTVLSPASSLPTAASYTQRAYQEVRHFAGGLIHHPYQSTKHFSILRHSHGLVFYQGPATSVTVSIFADAPLPADRKIWLQSKGWTGKVGMRARTLAGWNKHWLNVTPSTRITAEQLNPSDERAWQRDIASFARRANGSARANHKLRETAMIRIPVEAGDGYYRLLLCVGEKKKVLCPSPVFRVLSTSTSPSSLRGASLSTLPLEIGARVLSSAAKATVKTSIGSAFAPVTTAVQQQIQPYEPSWAAKTAVRAAYDFSGMAKKVDSSVQDTNFFYEEKRNESLGETIYEDLPDAGPKPPFPISFTGSVDYTSQANEEYGVPITYLTAIPEDILLRLHGYYFGWARNCGEKSSEQPRLDEGGSCWHKVIISVIPCNQFNAEKIENSIAIYFVQDDEEPIVRDAQIELQVMGFIRPPDQLADEQSTEKFTTDEVQAEAAVLSAINDIEIAQAFLDQPAWAPEYSVKQIKTINLEPVEKMKNSYADTRISWQKRINRVPLHKAGIRSPLDRFREETIGNGGMYVTR